MLDWKCEEEEHHRFNRFSIFHPCLSRSILFRLTTRTLQTHGIAVGHEWIHFMRWSRVPACCQTAAVTKLFVHRGCQPGCLNTSSLVYSPRGGGDKGKKPSKERAPSILDSVQLWIRIERQRAAGLDCKLLFLVNSVASAGPHVMRFPWGRLLGVSVIFSSWGKV